MVWLHFSVRLIKKAARTSDELRTSPINTFVVNVGIVKQQASLVKLVKWKKVHRLGEDGRKWILTYW